MLEQLKRDSDEHKSGAVKIEDLQNNEIIVSAVLQGANHGDKCDKCNEV
jgi:hypothetical protein